MIFSDALAARVLKIFRPVSGSIRTAALIRVPFLVSFLLLRTALSGDHAFAAAADYVRRAALGQTWRYEPFGNTKDLRYAELYRRSTLEPRTGSRSKLDLAGMIATRLSAALVAMNTRTL